MILRRDLIAALGGAVIVLPCTAGSQELNKKRRVGILLGVPPDDPVFRSIQYLPFIDSLKQYGWIEGKNYRLDVRFSPGGGTDGFRVGAAALVAQNPDVIIGFTPGAAMALKDATTTIPILFAIVTDPVGRGLVASVARPGGNITGMDASDPHVGGKLVQLLKQIAPAIEEIALVFNPDAPNQISGLSGSIERGAASLSVKMFIASIRNEREIDAVIDDLGRRRNVGFTCGFDAFAVTHRAQIIAAVARNRLPAIYPTRYWATDGGLMSYGDDQADSIRQLGLYVDRILRGAHPADLPVMSPRKFQLVINLKTAKAMGLDVPPLLFTGADEVIE